MNTGDFGDSNRNRQLQMKQASDLAKSANSADTMAETRQ